MQLINAWMKIWTSTWDFGTYSTWANATFNHQCWCRGTSVIILACVFIYIIILCIRAVKALLCLTTHFRRLKRAYSNVSSNMFKPSRSFTDRCYFCGSFYFFVACVRACVCVCVCGTVLSVPSSLLVACWESADLLALSIMLCFLVILSLSHIVFWDSPSKNQRTVPEKNPHYSGTWFKTWTLTALKVIKYILWTKKLDNCT